MKFLHTADWHIGRTLNGFSLLDDQKYVLDQIAALAKEHQVDGILLAGDIFDRSIPSVDAIGLYNDIISKLVLDSKIPVYAISGNHDGAKRLEYGTQFFETHHFHLRTTLKDVLVPIETETTQIYTLPFFDPMDARIQFGFDAELQTMVDAIGFIVDRMQATFDTSKTQILITHFAVSPSDTVLDPDVLTSETTSKVGGLTTVPSSCFASFDYVAMGHIHTRFASPSKTIAYSGSPMAFNTKEAKRNETKGVVLVDVEDTGVETTFLPLDQRTQIISCEGSFDLLTNPDYYQTLPLKQAFFSIKIVGYDRIQMQGVNVRSILESIYGSKIIEVVIEETMHSDHTVQTHEHQEALAPEVIIDQFYETVTGQPLTKYQSEVVSSILIALKEEK